MAPRLIQDVLDRVQSTTDWVLRTFFAFILRCLGVLLKAVFRSEDRAQNMDEQARRQKSKGEIVQRHMSGAAQKKHA